MYCLLHIHTAIYASYMQTRLSNVHVCKAMHCIYLREWLTSFFIASLEMACPQDSLIGGLASGVEHNRGQITE